MSGIADAAAFLDHFVRGDWASAHVRADGIELFVARVAGHPNPMVDGVAPDDASSAASAASVATRTTLRAPHLGTVVALAEVGTTVAAGATYATLDLLGETIDLRAAEEGVVIERLTAVGSLAEYDVPLIALA